MVKVTITSEAVNYIAEEEIIREHEQKAHRTIRKERIAELISEGVDKEVAKVMADLGI